MYYQELLADNYLLRSKEMLGFFKKSPITKLEQQYRLKMEKALEAQRNGNINLYSQLSFEAEEIYKEIEKIKKEQSQRD
mgnify:CR=1 FL=1|jgi:hypothetical protein